MPTTLAAPGAAVAVDAAELDLPLGRARRTTVLDGVEHVADWLDRGASGSSWPRSGEWARPPAGLRHPRVPTGHLMSVQSVCLGWHWQPYVYSPHRRRHRRGAGEAAPRRRRRARPAGAVADTFGADAGAAFAPDAAIVNLYAAGARLGLHQDGEEPSDAPVVTISLGDTCTFRFAGVDRRTGRSPTSSCSSGDLLVFGGPQPADLPRRPEGVPTAPRPPGSACRRAD